MYSFRSLTRNLPPITGRGRLSGIEGTTVGEGAHGGALREKMLLSSRGSAIVTLANNSLDSSMATRGGLGQNRLQPQRRRYRRNLYRNPNCTVLAGDAELPRPKNGELNTPTILVTLTRLIALNTSTVMSKLSRLFPL